MLWNVYLYFIDNPWRSEIWQEIACYLGLELGKIKIKRFADGEIYVQLQESVRGCDVYLVQPTCPPANEKLMELLIMIDACRRASAKTITAVIPYFGYARADRKVTSCCVNVSKWLTSCISWWLWRDSGISDSRTWIYRCQTCSKSNYRGWCRPSSCLWSSFRAINGLFWHSSGSCTWAGRY